MYDDEDLFPDDACPPIYAVALRRISYAEFVAGRSEKLIDDTDRQIAGHFEFTEEEFDFIINYDIKYRMGVDTFEAVSFEEAGA